MIREQGHEDCVAQTKVEKNKNNTAVYWTHYSTHDMKEKYIVDELEPDATRSLSDQQKTAIMKLSTGVALVWYVYNVRFLHSRDEHGTATKTPGCKTETVLEEPCYDKRRKWDNTSAVYHLLEQTDINDVTKVQQDVMMIRAHAHISCLDSWSALWYNGCASEQREEHTAKTEHQIVW